MALNEAKEKVRQLENAIKKVDLIKRHLSHNVSDIKGEIHLCVSHNLECLRGREVSLLGKVDEVVSLKEEALQQQQAQLNQALGVLRTRMALISTDSALDKQMAEILTKFNEIELSPGETPHIAFRADHMSLRECILNYGRVDSNALPLPSAFDDPGKPSASLPRHLEEYEDVDHHIFHKTVEEVMDSSSKTRSITVSIPKLSTKMEDWLQKRLTSQEETHHAPSRPNAFPSFGSSGVKMSTQSCNSTPSDTCSLNNWLSQIKHHADLEEEHDFEIVDNSCSGKGKCNGINGDFEDLKQWLHNSPGYVENIIAQKQSQNCFQHVPLDLKVWLHQSSPQNSSADEIKQKDFFHHVSKETSTWLRSRAYGKQPSQHLNGSEGESGKPKPLAFKDKNISQWLAQSSKPKQEKIENGNNNNCCRQAPRQQEGKTPSISFQLEDICKANELCSSLSDCVCKPDCAIMCQQELSGVKNPLDPTKVFNPPQLPLSQWLLPAAAPDHPVNCEKMDICQTEIVDGVEKSAEDSQERKGIFSHTGDVDLDQWLFKPPGPASEVIPSHPNPAFKHNKEETNLWLQQIKESSSSSSAQEANTKVLFNFTPACKSLSEWLLPPSPKPSEAPASKEDQVMREDSEGWSLCSSPSSYNSEQFSKDVGVATSYMQKWVLS